MGGVRGSGTRRAARMAGLVLKRLLWMAVVLVGITLVSFAVIHLAPGKASDVQAGFTPTAGEGARERLAELYGLDEPLHVQYGKWLGRMARFDFGQSLSGDRRPVWERIRERLPLTFGMNAAALALTLVIAVPIGAVSAARAGGLFDRASTVIVFLGFATPGFWLAILLILPLRHPLARTARVRAHLPGTRDPALLGQGLGPGAPFGPARVPLHIRRAGLHVALHAFGHARGHAPRTTSSRPGPRGFPSAWCFSATPCATRSCP